MTRIAFLVTVCASVAASACVVVTKEPPPPAPPPAAPAAAPAATPQAAPNRQPVAQPSATGKPPNLMGGEGGIWIWRDANLWHVRTTTKGKKHSFSGRVTGKGAQVTDVQSAKVESGDKI